MADRTFNTIIRSDWNGKIHIILKAIDLHTELYLQTGDAFHIKQSEILRDYVHELKTWIHYKENLHKVKNDGQV